MIRILGVTVLALLLGACSARSCKLEGDYLQAREMGPLVNPGNGELPARDPTYDIPPIPDETIHRQRKYTAADGTEQSDCADRPPRLPPATDA